ncbi:Bud site selection protein 6 [Gryganskiella cystojenkinii]|nr:Bud site selection protein 6 [Gryganskiella cystojenkinii]
MQSIQENPRHSMGQGYALAPQQSPPSSTTTASTTRRRKTDQGTMNPIEATVTKLLVATKQLLEGLTLWSTRKMAEEQVSDIFVQLATQFNLASQSFHEVGIDTSELAHIPDDLRSCLETALGEDPSPASLDLYLPRIKEVIINLLQGLRLKQNVYREQYEAQQASRMQRTTTGTTPQLTSSSPTTTTTTTTTRVRTSVSGGHPQQQQQPRMSLSMNSAPVGYPAVDQIGVNNPTLTTASNGIGSGAGDAHPYSGINKMSNPTMPSMPTLPPPPPPTFSVSTPRDEPLHAETLASLRKSDAITRRASSRRHSQRFSTLLEQNAPPVPRRHPISDSNLLTTYPGYNGSQYGTPLASPNLPFSPLTTYQNFPPVSPALSTSSSSGGGAGTGNAGGGGYMDAMPLPPTTPVPQLPHGLHEKGTSGPTAGFPPAPSGAMPTIPSAETTKILAESGVGPVLVSDDLVEPEPTATAAATAAGVGDTSVAVTEASVTGPVEPVAITPSEPAVIEHEEPSLTLFLQVGKSVKKTKFEGELTHSGLRMLFMEKFQYNPGQEDFPIIYVKDPHTNIHYELESLADVQQNAFLSLNVDDLENIQRKMDQGFAALTKEIHDIKKAQETQEQARQKAAAAAASAANNQPERSASNPESSQMLRSVVKKVLAKNKTLPPPLSPLTSTSSSSPQSKVSAAELKSRYDEIQTLRRDLGVMRQLYTELQTDTKSMLGSLQGYTSQLRKQALEAPVSSRLFIENGKVKLDKKSEDLTNKIEDLQDVVEDMKTNVTQRRGRPSDNSIAFVDKQCEEIGKEIEGLSDYIQTLRPSWKKTWEVELQTIVKEQMFLKEQEGLLEDLKEDRSSLLQTLGNLKKLMELQQKNGGGGSLGGGKPKDYFFAPVVDEGFEGLKTVMEEVKLISPDSDKRLKAMAQMEKLRHIELSNRIDEFEEELTTFVGASKLRKTGGALEAERQRQQRDSENLKAMFAAKNAASAGAVPVVESSPSAVETIQEEEEEEGEEEGEKEERQGEVVEALLVEKVLESKLSEHDVLLEP